jgi:hypothetical protein
VAGLLWFVPTVAFLFLGTRDAAHGAAFRLSMLVMLAWFIPVAIYLCVGNARAFYRERDAGYTTWARSDLTRWLLNWRTGEVLRPPSR